MYIAIEDVKQVAVAQGKFLKRLYLALPQLDGSFTVGFQSGNYTFDDLRSNGRIWFGHLVSREAKIPRNWNAFGFAGDLRSNASNTIVTEVNTALDGRTKMVAGLFVKDQKSGNTILIHSGRIGGGKKGVGKTAFLESYRGSKIDYVRPEDTSKVFHGIVVADLGSDEVVSQIEAFVTAVWQFKRNSATSDAATLSNEDLRKKADRANQKPRTTTTSVIQYTRDFYVSTYAKRRANGKCELCNQRAPFLCEEKPYLECHHIRWLAHGGRDCIENTVALCPNCHRRMHLVKDPKSIKKLLARAKVTL